MSDRRLVSGCANPSGLKDACLSTGFCLPLYRCVSSTFNELLSMSAHAHVHSSTEWIKFEAGASVVEAALNAAHGGKALLVIAERLLVR